MIYRFDAFELDLAKFELRAEGQVRPVEPQVFALLALLVGNRERLVTRDEIIEKVWDGRIVSDAAIASRVKSARQALGDDGTRQRFIRTVHRQGFRFVAEAKVVGSAATQDATPPAEHASRPSVAVLPFRLLGEAGPYAAIADALPHELIAELARLRWLFVTARGSSFRLRGADADAAGIGGLLGVRYYLAGTVEVAGARLVVTVQLIDTRDGGIVWAERFAGAVDDVHQVREDIRARILSALEIHIPMHEAVRARLATTGNLDAWSAYHLGLQHMYRFNRTDNESAAALFRQSLTEDPGFARAHAGLSFVHFQTAFMHYTDDRAGAIALCRRFATRALELDPIDPFANFAMGRSFWLDGDLDSSLAWLERTTSISPHYAQGIYARAWTETLAGRAAEGRGHADLAMRLSPLDPLYYGMLGTRAFSHMVDGDDAQAATWAGRAARAPGAHVLIAMIAAAAHALAGDATRARAWAAQVRARNPALTRDDFFRAFPMQSASLRERLSTALARLGF
ncbi:winged helix-turn-helix domain-containing tetratricopeptide repeat protein [Fulvimonas yonginensis]|uniref:Winged helix-turn-helix domain-containing protein n=1 Tax=Fulvimonas yonginensis TaxID=1495200 RepID=A0ABU8JE46_9GAMM